MELDDLRLFLAIVRRGTLTAAQEDAHLSQPALSRRLQRLERELGTPLFAREGRGLRLTRAGMALHERAGAILTEVGALAAAVAAEEGAGPLRVGGSVTACTYLLPPVLARFRSRRPGHPVRVLSEASSRIADRVLERVIDVGVAAVLAPVRGVRAHPWRDLTLAVVAPRGEAPGRASLSRLRAERFILPASGSVRTLIDQVFSRAGGLPEIVAECDSLEVVRALAGAGFGWAILPTICIPGPSPELRRVALREPLPALPVAVLVAADAHPAPGVEEFLAALECEG